VPVTQGWTNGPDKMTCEMYSRLWCENGDARPGKEWAVDRPQYRQPRLNCCVCGKTGCESVPTQHVSNYELKSAQPMQAKERRTTEAKAATLQQGNAAPHPISEVAKLKSMLAGQDAVASVTEPGKDAITRLRSMLYATKPCGMARFREEFQADLVVSWADSKVLVSAESMLYPDESGWVRLQVCCLACAHRFKCPKFWFSRVCVLN
jgi:hypothetical protein